MEGQKAKTSSDKLETTDARNKLQDLSGVTIPPGANPYQALIEACEDDAVCGWEY